LNRVGRLESFETDWAAPGDWAAMYRAAGLQVVPSHMPSSGQNWKRPALADWKSLQEEMVPQATFDRWYAPKGEHASRLNMGLLTGRASDNVFVIDLDDYKDTGARMWWLSVLNEHNHGIEPETCQQVTGGGGRQLLFRAPPGWQAPTNKTPIGVDIRGQGGFAVLPPSQHVSGTPYAWKAGCAPWECEIAAAPDWLLQAVFELVERHGGDTNRDRGPELHLEAGKPGLAPSLVPSAPGEFDAFGARVDGRDHYMRDLVWGAVVNWYRECPIIPSDAESQARMREVWAVYERKVKTRIAVATDNAAGLEAEGRGATLFVDKWRRAMSKWSSDVADAASKPMERDEWHAATMPTAMTQTAVSRFLFEKVRDLRKLPPAQWLVKEWIPERATGIFYGKWAAGKSFIGFDLGLHLAYGMPDWHGAELPGQSVHVLVIAREGHQGFVNRVDAFKKQYGLVDDPEHMTFMRGSVSFMRDEEFAALIEAIKADATLYRLVIVDTVARVLPGVDMNEQQTVTLFMERIGLLAEVTGASAIGVHHQNKSGGMMGSTFFEANADFVFEVSRDGEEDGPLKSGEITCTKMKDGEDRWNRTITYKKVPLSILPEGPSSLVVERIGTPPPAAARGNGWPDKDVCRRVLADISSDWESGKPWSVSPQSQDRFGPRLMHLRFDISAKIAREMLQTWLGNNVLSIEIRNTDTKQKGLQVIGSID
jgi:hypothetical protein